MARKIILKPRLKKSGKYLKACWYDKEASADLSVEEIAEELNIGSSIELDMSYNGKYNDKFHPEKLIFNLIERIEFIQGLTDTAFTKRILDNGGMVAYAHYLESRIQPTIH